MTSKRVDIVIRAVNARIPNSVTPATKITIHPSEWIELVNEIMDLRGADETTEPIPMILHCPQCRTTHVDEPNPERGWTNPPHRSHECQNCECIWRPADVPTTGVLHISTKGRADTVDNTSLSSKENCEHGFRKGRCTFCVPSSPVEPSPPPPTPWPGSNPNKRGDLDEPLRPSEKTSGV